MPGRDGNDGASGEPGPMGGQVRCAKIVALAKQFNFGVHYYIIKSIPILPKGRVLFPSLLPLILHVLYCCLQVVWSAIV